MDMAMICALQDGGGHKEGGAQETLQEEKQHTQKHTWEGEGCLCCLCWVLGQLRRKGMERLKKHSQKEKGTSMLASISLPSRMVCTQAHRLSSGTLSPHSECDPLMSMNP